MTTVEQLAEFVVRVNYEELSKDARQALKIRVLDSLGCALGALDGVVPKLVRQQVEDFGGAEQCALIGGGRTAPDRAAFYNSALVRYLDFNDSYLAKGETCHPSDNLGAVLAAAEYAGSSGREFLAALAVAYQVQCRLSDEAPVRAKGFDHTTQGAYAVAAGVSRALGLDPAAHRQRHRHLPERPSTRCGSRARASSPTGRDWLIRTPPSAAPMRPFWPCAASPGPWRSSKATKDLWRPSPGRSRSTGRRRTWNG